MLIISLLGDEVVESSGTGIYVTDMGSVRELSKKEAEKLAVGFMPNEVKKKTKILYTDNISSRLKEAAQISNLHKVLWRPWSITGSKKIKAGDLIPYLEKGLGMLLDASEQIREESGLDENPELIDRLIDFTRGYVKACKKYSSALVLSEEI